MICERQQGDDQWLKLWMFTDETTFHVNGRVNTASFGEQRISYELERARPKEKVWCGVTTKKVYGPFFFAEETSCRQLSWHDRTVCGPSITSRWDTGQHYLSTGWRSTALGYHSEGTIKPHIQRCGRDGPIPWPPNSPDLTPSRFFCMELRQVDSVCTKTTESDWPTEGDCSGLSANHCRNAACHVEQYGIEVWFVPRA
jgi:hypothetical protein